MNKDMLCRTIKIMKNFRMSCILPTVRLKMVFKGRKNEIFNNANLSNIAKYSINKVNMHLLELEKYLQRMHVHVHICTYRNR